MQDKENATHLDFSKIFYTAPQLVVKGKTEEYGQGEIRVRQTGK